MAGCGDDDKSSASSAAPGNGPNDPVPGPDDKPFHGKSTISPNDSPSPNLEHTEFSSVVHPTPQLAHAEPRPPAHAEHDNDTINGLEGELCGKLTTFIEKTPGVYTRIIHLSVPFGYYCNRRKH